VYGSQHGVFVYDGGQVTKKLSTQLEGFFWDHAPQLNYSGHRGRFGWWQPWVLAPNGFAYDTRSNGWWRLDDPSTHLPYSAYAVTSKGQMLAFPHAIDQSNSVLYNWANTSQLADKWSWKSQPMVQTRDRTFKVRDVQILATNSVATETTVTVTITGFDDRGATVTMPALTFTLNATSPDRPQLMTLDVQTATTSLTYLQVKVVANNPVSTQPAPKLHSISLGVVESNPIAKAG
jgi:hypothetical protein